ncbi:protein scabrous [Ischnura elegans]|uniref:protein scabrous n=1 Tax=Ischnura elegans TaxID=197161 RepID=UPI001ED87712|nr:protein scabrous [Ischnura elegans]
MAATRESRPGGGPSSVLLIVLLLACSAVSLSSAAARPETVPEREDFAAGLRAEMQELRRQVESLRNQRGEERQQVSATAPRLAATSEGGNRARNDRLTAQWMRAAVRELRAEAEESAASQRRSAAEARLQHAEVSSALSLLRSDAASLRRDLEESRTESQRLAAHVQQLKTELAQAREEHRATSTACSQTETEMKALQSEWLDLSKILQSSTTEKNFMMEKFMDTQNDQKSTVEAVDEHKVRHLGHVHKQLYNLRQSDKQIFTAQLHLEKRIKKLEKMAKVISNRSVKKSESHEHRCRDGNGEIALSTCALQSLIRQLEDKVAGMEEVQRVSAKSIAFNSSRQTAALDKLHLSTLQLLESVQAIEDKVDHNIPELQREISKLEFGMAQALASARAAKEEQENGQETIKAMQDTLEELQEKERGEVGALGAVQAQLINITSRMEAGEQGLASKIMRLEDYLLDRRPQRIIKDDAKDTANSKDNHLIEKPINGSNLPDLFQRLTRVQKSYLEVVNQLPKDCSEVSGPSGLYLLHPLAGGNEGSLNAEGESSADETLPSPLLVYCDQDTHDGGWAVIQRRINGHKDFNRSWKEYQTGFGSPAGEFWIGNEALHRITSSNNCTSLRIDIIDIYGRAWYAEYSHFFVANSSDGYRLSVNGYSGDAGDALDYQNGMQFSAKDSDRDSSSTDCAASYEGGWWFSHCQHANLNGRYGLGLTWFDGTRNEWIAVAHSVMKVRERGVNGKCPSSSEEDSGSHRNRAHTHTEVNKETSGSDHILTSSKILDNSDTDSVET